MRRSRGAGVPPSAPVDAVVGSPGLTTPKAPPPESSLYRPEFERDACGVGFIAERGGRKTREVVRLAIRLLHGVTHRGATGFDPETGDGCGILVQIPHAFFSSHARLEFPLPRAGAYGVGQLFLSCDEEARRAELRLVEEAVRAEGFRVLGWRDVPIDASACGQIAHRTLPQVVQVFVSASALQGRSLERRLYVLRRVIERNVKQAGASAGGSLYACSFSSRTIVYKGLLLPRQIERFYPDLGDESFTSALAIAHQRFSTNTFPSWERAHPYRLVAHNGEINTLRGNLNAFRARESLFASPEFGTDLDKLLPVVDGDGSDSAMLDNVLELLQHTGRSLPHALAMMVPQAWEGDRAMSPELRSFYEFHASLMEPWDGPALVAFSDGEQVGACLDRNGLRPARLTVTTDDLVIVASEAGAVDIPPARIRTLGRLPPGGMVVVDTKRKRLLGDRELKADLAAARPYREWLASNLVCGRDLEASERDDNGTTPPAPLEEQARLRFQRINGYTREDLRLLMAPMATKGEEPLGAMGDDSALAVLSEGPQLLYAYFKQLFAQVTNPPIDPIRESLVMSLRTLLGAQGNLFLPEPAHCRQIELEGPVLSDRRLAAIAGNRLDGLGCARLDMFFPACEGGLREGLDRLRHAAARAVEEGAAILVLSDRGTDAKRAPIPALLAVAAVHHHLIRCGLRPRASLVAESAEAREVMHVCLLIGYGASAVNPWLALETLSELGQEDLLEGLDPGTARANYVAALERGVQKVLSKMGISTLQSYVGAQVFEAVGLGCAFVEEFFTGTASRLGGIELEQVERECLLRFESAALPADDLDWGGRYKWRRDGERHQLTPNVIGLLQHAVRSADYRVFRKYTRFVDERTTRGCDLRGLLDFRPGTAVPLDEVEPASEIVRRFRTGAMSFGSLSSEAHQTLAVAMNRLGGRSNSGEGGEDPERYRPRRGAASSNSTIKQVASGRFGVTPSYLLSADEIQIKMAQGAKPGEGGHLPGHKVDEVIARVRHAAPGVGLISPPPHHDIYSIEDLAQLIHDLKHANPRAEVSVKLVSEVGVGTVAAGVAKAKADRIVVCGHSGGTGASPLSSIKHTGLPWEIGLAETQQVLVANRLRGRVVLETDGQFKTGRDVLIAAMLGAESFGFGTAALIASGCILTRVCHLNTCPVGVATQDPALRARFTGLPDHVMNFMLFVAEEVRELMAELGIHRLDEVIGRARLLCIRDGKDRHWKARHLDLEPLLHVPEEGSEAAFRYSEGQPCEAESSLERHLLDCAAPALREGRPVSIRATLRPSDRTVGARLSCELTRRHGSAGLPVGTVRVALDGVAGQSFGAFLSPGVELTLTGFANDAVAKGMAGGRVTVLPPSDMPAGDERSRVVIGNVALYGATGGELLVRGAAGERFAVRNSGASAVVEGVGDHACEYMTGGTVVVLGGTGRNFAAGMSGGIAYVSDPGGDFASCCNPDMVDLGGLEAEDEERVRAWLRRHFRATQSPLAFSLLAHWTDSRRRFVKVKPKAGAPRPVRDDVPASRVAASGG